MFREFVVGFREFSGEFLGFRASTGMRSRLYTGLWSSLSLDE
jgi:hypothetical protein